MNYVSRHRIWIDTCPADNYDHSGTKHTELMDDEPNCPDCGAIDPDHPVHMSSASSASRGSRTQAQGIRIIIDLTESPENPRRERVFRPERPRRAEVPIKEDEKEKPPAGPNFMGMPRPLAPPVAPAAPAALVLVPRSADPVRPQQPARPGEAAMGRAIISRARTGAFQERAQRKQPHHHGGHPRSTEIPTALAKVTKAKETKAKEQDRINSEGLFIQVIIYECRWKQITVRGKDYSWEQIQKDKLSRSPSCTQHITDSSNLN
ncbi:hypothetical protein N7G274_001843 [Stereocaulon virgatum]|uniref:Uncharacterized protein n=1 Tax=Stereocaulon virgatum TaxID=373712 RepID=A0ABR4ANM2_9LECA